MPALNTGAALWSETMFTFYWTTSRHTPHHSFTPPAHKRVLKNLGGGGGNVLQPLIETVLKATSVGIFEYSFVPQRKGGPLYSPPSVENVAKKIRYCNGAHQQAVAHFTHTWRPKAL